MEEETFSDLSGVVIRLYDAFQSSAAAGREPGPVVVQLVAESFRCLRGACVQNPRSQDTIRY